MNLFSCVHQRLTPSQRKGHTSAQTYFQLNLQIEATDQCKCVLAILVTEPLSPTNTLAYIKIINRSRNYRIVESYSRRFIGVHWVPFNDYTCASPPKRNDQYLRGALYRNQKYRGIANDDTVCLPGSRNPGSRRFLSAEIPGLG